MKFPDTLNLNYVNILRSKTDTLYLRNLNPEKKEKESFWEKLIPIIGVLVGGLIGFWSQKFSKKQEKNVNSYNLKESKRINCLETIFQDLNKLSLFDRDSSVLMIQKIQDIEKYANDNTLHIDKSYEKIIQNLCDYYKEVSNDFTTKDYSKENLYMNQFKKLFNK